MDSINIVMADTMHKLPDLSNVFARELNNILLKLKYFKGQNFDIVMDTGYAMVYYALKMNIEYQRQGNGSVPSNIVDEIWNQVLKASKTVYKVCEDDVFNKEVTNIYYNKIKESFIVSETLNFWKHYRF